jgi:hypothetical protein
MNGLKQWIRCLAGNHEWALLETVEGRVYEICLCCGEQAEA